MDYKKQMDSCEFDDEIHEASVAVQRLSTTEIETMYAMLKTLLDNHKND